MAGIRDDSAGPYGQWTNDPNQSWGDYLKMLGMDAGGAAYNALANITGALSPVGSSPEGNMALQVPPMVSGLYDSAKRIGERGGFTRVEEFDAPLKQDLANALLTFYGGNALSGLAKPRGALGAGAMREAGGVSLSGQHPNYQIMNDGSPVGRAYVREYPETIQLGQLHVDPEFQRQGIATEAQRQLAQQYGKPTVPDVSLSQAELARWQKNDPAAVADYEPFFGSNNINSPRQGTDAYWASQGSGVVPGTRASRGELFSDNKPSILGAALATAGEQPIRAYRGVTNAGNVARDDASILWGSSSPDVASTYARPHFNTGDIQGAVAPLDVNFSNPLTVDAKNGSWVGLEHNGQRYTADDLATLARDQGHDGLIVKNVMDAKSWYPGDPKLAPADNYVALQRGTVKSPLTGETLFSRGVPLPPQQDDNLPPWLKF